MDDVVYVDVQSDVKEVDPGWVAYVDKVEKKEGVIDCGKLGDDGGEHDEMIVLMNEETAQRQV